MALAIPQMKEGACVEVTHDLEGIPVKVRRRGYIVGVDKIKGGEATGGIRGVYVQFRPNEEAELTAPATLSLVRPHDATAEAMLRRKRDNARAQKESERDFEILDETEVHDAKLRSEHDLQEVLPGKANAEQLHDPAPVPPKKKK